MPKESFLVNRTKSVGYALKGAWLLIRTEPSIQIQAIVALLVTAAGFYFDISATEWMVQLLAITAIMAMEGINTAIEKLCDYVQPEHHPKIGFIKDVSAGAVMIVAILTSIIGAIIYGPKLF